MQEFSSVTASSYDADALAPLLSEKSAEGWDVISIVSAGTNIVAYLSREVPGSGDDAGDTVVVDTFEEVIVVEDGQVVADEITVGEQIIVDGEVVSDEQVVVDALAEDTPAVESEVESDVEQVPADAGAADSGQEDGGQVEAAAAAGAGAVAAAAVDEPAGWAAEPETAATPEAESEPSVEELAAQVSEPVAEPVSEPVVEAVEPAVAEPVAEPVQEPAPEPAPVESTVPAGWYADPSGRYELRYWDGTAWTEHVSRAGQQFTDPPVA